MKALTVRQPWASLIISGGKDIENREWYTGVRGRVAIHSSARMTKADMDDACAMLSSWIPNFSGRRFQQDTFPTGMVLGTVEIIGCVQKSDSPWFVGRYGFVLRNAIALSEPIPCKGALGFWDVPALILPRIEGGSR